MRNILLSILLLVCIGASKPSPAGWSAYTTWNKSVPVTKASGDVVTLSIPTPADRIKLVAFLTEPVSVDLTGRTITITGRIDQTGNPQYFMGIQSGCGRGPNMRLYFTTVSGTYDLRNANSHPTQYWWADVGDLYFPYQGTFYMTVPLDPLLWSDALGVSAADEPAAFAAALKQCKVIGLSFGGGCYFDTGVGISGGGTATLHVTGFSIN